MVRTDGCVDRVVALVSGRSPRHGGRVTAVSARGRPDRGPWWFCSTSPDTVVDAVLGEQQLLDDPFFHRMVNEGVLDSLHAPGKTSSAKR